MKFSISNFIDRLFRMEEMNGGYRWELARVGGLRIDLHHFVTDDWLGDMHDHPARGISIGLFGKSREKLPEEYAFIGHPACGPSPASHTHRITMVDRGSCWTIMIMLKPVRTWGFWTSAGWKPWDEYGKARGLEEIGRDSR